MSNNSHLPGTVVKITDLPTTTTLNVDSKILVIHEGYTFTISALDIISGISVISADHLSDFNNPHQVTKTQVGLGNVDNTSDLNKPVSTATFTALSTKQDLLVTGLNIKTVNGQSILGSGDIPFLVTSVNGKTGNLILTTTDISEGANLYYTDDKVQTFSDTRYVSLFNFYSNPTWISSLNWSKITNRPSTLSGYGITDPIVLTTNTYVNPSWITSIPYSKITGAPIVPSILNDLSDVNITSLSTSQVLMYDGTTWKNADNIAESRLSALTDVQLTTPVIDDVLQYDGVDWINVPASSVGATSLSGLSDILLTTPTTGQALFYDGTKWVNQYVPDNALWGNISGTLSNQTDLQDALNLKQNSLITKPNEGITLDINSNLGTIYNTGIADSVNSVAVGGAAVQPASSWKTKNIVQVLDSILFPDQLPTYTIPTISISASQTGIREIGSTISQALTVTANKNDSGVFTQLEIIRGSTQISVVNNPTGSAITDIAAQFGYSDPNNPNRRYTLSFTDSFVVVSGATNWKGEGDYQAGLPKQNNKGVTDTRAAAVRNTNAPQAASNNFSTSNQSVTGIYPYFWGVSNTQPTAASIAAAIAAGTANKVLTDASGTVTVTFAASAKFLWMVHAASYTTKTKWFNTALNNGNIGSPTDLFGPVVTQAVNSPNGFWSGVNFKMYISTFATSTTGSIEFRNS
jgi:hypothetical protein